MLLKGGDIVRIVILLYLAIWGYYYYRLYSYTHKATAPKLKKLENAWINRMFAKYCGIVIAFFSGIFLTFFLPNLNLVTYQEDPDSDLAAIEGIDYDRYYVPFYWDGRFFSPFQDYIVNQTDDTLAIYKATLFDGLFTAVSSPDSFELIEPHEAVKRNHHVRYFYPSEEVRPSYYNFNKEYARKTVVEWNLDTYRKAIQEVDRIRYLIDHPDPFRVNTIEWKRREHLDSMLRERILHPVSIDVYPVDIDPKDLKPKDIKPKDITSRDIKPKDTTPKDIEINFSQNSSNDSSAVVNSE